MMHDYRSLWEAERSERERQAVRHARAREARGPGAGWRHGAATLMRGLAERLDSSSARTKSPCGEAHHQLS